MAKVKLDARQAAAAYATAFQRIKNLPGFSQGDVLRPEVGVILKLWAGRTKVVTAEKAERRMRSGIAWKMNIQKAGSGNPYRTTVNDGSRGGFRGQVWMRTAKTFRTGGLISDEGQFTPAHYHWKDDDWQKLNYAATVYAAMMRRRRPMVQRSLSLSRQSVVQIADDLGIDLATVQGGGLNVAGLAKARAAIASSGVVYRNGVGRFTGDNIKCAFDLICRLPYGRKIGMDRALASALATRATFINRAYARGALDSIRKTAKAFPNMFKTEGLRLAA